MLAFPWLVLRSLRTGRYRRSWKDQLFGLKSQIESGAEPGPSARTLIWLHGVSVGEVQLLRALFAALIERYPHSKFAVSTTTATGMALAERLFPDHVRRFYFPLDFTWAVQRTLNTLRPSLIVLGELELWPNLVELSKRSKVPVAVVNGRLSERSYRGYMRLAWLTRSTFSKLDLVAAQTDRYATRFADCGTTRGRIVTTGSMKFDNLIFARDAPEVRRLSELIGLDDEHCVWVVGSTQAGEESACCAAYLHARQRFPNLRLIVVPRHPERFDEVHEELRASGLQVLRRSRLIEPSPDGAWDVLLVDTIGELRWWWGLADLALVGGSFGARGGQNMLEPAAYGTNVAFGPNTSNFRDIVELLLASDAAQRIASLEDIEPWLFQQLDEPEAGQQRGRNAQRVISQHQGAIARTVDCLDRLLNSPIDAK